MPDYEERRREWLAHLRESGEYARLSMGERRILETGSLDVLRTTQMVRLLRRERTCRRVATAILAALAASFAAALLQASFLPRGHGPGSGVLLAGVPLAACWSAALLGPGALWWAARWFATRRRVYLALPMCSWPFPGLL